MFPVFLRPRGSKNANLLSSPSTLSKPNANKASAKELFVSPKLFALAFDLICPAVFSVVDEVLVILVLTRSAHDLAGALRTGGTAFDVSSEGELATWLASTFVEESSSVVGVISAVLVSFDFSTTVDAAGLRSVCFGRAGKMGTAGTTGLLLLFGTDTLFGGPTLLEDGRTEDGVVG